MASATGRRTGGKSFYGPMAFDVHFSIKTTASACVVCGSSYFLYSNYMLCQRVHRHCFIHSATQGQQEEHENGGEAARGQWSLDSVGLHGPFDFALAFTVFNGVALVVFGLTFGQSDFAFDFTGLPM